MAAYPLPFLDEDFIETALTGSDTEFTFALTLLNAQTHIPVNGNTGLLFWQDASPIAYAMRKVFLTHAARTAKLIEALYLRCGIPTTRLPSNDRYTTSPLCRAVLHDNFTVFETLTTKCNATFDARDNEHNDGILHILASRGDKAVRYLNLLTHLDGMDPNHTERVMGNTALHIAVSQDNQSPDAVRLLIRAFGADPTIRNNLVMSTVRGLLPLETLKKMEAERMEQSFASDATRQTFQDNVRKTERLLTHTERATAVLMGVCLETRNQESELRHLDKEMVALILAFADV
jgi:hypothetical protein